MSHTKDNDVSRGAGKSSSGPTRKKLSRREFAKTSVVAGAAAVTLPNILRAEPQSADEAPAAAKSSPCLLRPFLDIRRKRAETYRQKTGVRKSAEPA